MNWVTSYYFQGDAAGHLKGSKHSVSSTGKSSSDVSWHHLKLYKEDSSDSLNNG